MIASIEKKNVLFITTKRLDYIRNTQEFRLLEKHTAYFHIVGSNDNSYFFRLIRVYIQLLFTPVKAFDTIFIGFAPQLILPFFAWKLGDKYRIIDFFISIYDTFCCDRRVFRPKGLIGRLLHWLDSFTIKHADTIICDTKCHGDYFVDEFHADRDKLYLLYLEADPAIYHPMTVPKPDIAKGKHTVLFFGSMLPLQGYELVLEAFYTLKDYSDYFFYFIGPLADSLKNKVKDMPNLYLYDWLGQEELARYIAFSDLRIAGHFNAEIEKASRTIPGKAYIYHAMKKPMILGDTPANHERFTADRNIILIPTGDSLSITNAILRFFGDPSLQPEYSLPDAIGITPYTSPVLQAGQLFAASIPDSEA